ncbi:MAG TPA: hypothetical protein VJW93_02680 [Candidatus Acidoferrales bacterium]|nr:hypothetical protein [Candidatus Acidoferrales bacterium]
MTGGLMNRLIPLIWAAGAVQLAILAANFVMPEKLRCRENLVRVSPMIRQVFIVHWIYILGILAIFSALCFRFAPELASGSRIGHFLSAAIALFWLPRIPIQLFVYDAELRRQHRLGDVAMLLAIAFVVLVFGAAALGVRLG